jgi:hypothetical protein
MPAPSQGGGNILNDPNQLRDMISQVVSSQLQLHIIRKSRGGGAARVNIEDEYEDDFVQEEEKMNQTSRTMQEEEARTKAEQAETKRQMFINVQPYVAQTMNL